MAITVREIIEELQKFDQDLPVVVGKYDGWAEESYHEEPGEIVEGDVTWQRFVKDSVGKPGKRRAVENYTFRAVIIL